MNLRLAVYMTVFVKVNSTRKGKKTCRNYSRASDTGDQNQHTSWYGSLLLICCYIIVGHYVGNYLVTENFPIKLYRVSFALVQLIATGKSVMRVVLL